MTRNDVIDLLTVMTAADGIDRRSKITVDFWCATVGDLQLADALDAVAAFHRDHDGWIRPVHIRQRVAQVRADRLMRHPIPDPPDHVLDDPDPLAYTRWEAEQRQRIMDRPDVDTRAIEGGRR